MRLRRFTAKAVHGYLDFDIPFHRDLTMLTGINGSGKTSVLNSIVALISPDLSTLSNLKYDSLSVELEDDGKTLKITAEATPETVALGVSTTGQDLHFTRYVPDPDIPLHRQLEHEAEHFRELAGSCASHPVMRSINALPTPMFLGLDRRARFEADDRRVKPAYYRPSARTGRNVFSASLTRSLSDAADLAETKYRDALISSGQIGEELQRDMLLSLITVSPEEFSLIAVPSAAELGELERLKEDLNALPAIFNLPRNEVQRRVAPFLDELQKAADAIPKNASIEDLLKSRSKNSQALTSAVSWSSNRSQLKRIKVISEVVATYNQRQEDRLEPTKRYLSLVNQFLRDSGKSVGFSERGYVHVDVHGLNEPKPISYLSSGEAQIFVILTHLSFNPLAQEANAFIIDEPELSLHVRWQELFVDSVQSANPNIQYILATHSPSIILDKLKKCVDISRSFMGPIKEAATSRPPRRREARVRVKRA